MNLGNKTISKEDSSDIFLELTKNEKVNEQQIINALKNARENFNFIDKKRRK